ncbi:MULTISPECIES: hypothetical protein [Actibacterium]|uniref:Uncharacterized protein n=1 Tax=Actibacterium naphthalenivorans TaxID=1614693 RepID=A0A840CJ90_9RHOB|nr:MULTISPECIES: hypothetical protein [Actibacterium]MBB4023548.1 hypothetical protein [Actibacterium naphthalenivorans]
MVHEYELTRPVLEALNESLLGELSTTDLRREIKARIALDASDYEPLKNRPDCRIDQVVRNIKSHKKALETLLPRVSWRRSLADFGSPSMGGRFYIEVEFRGGCARP